MDKLILHMLFYTGLRRSELIALNCGDINLGIKALCARTSKNKIARIISIHPKVVKLLDL